MPNPLAELEAIFEGIERADDQLSNDVEWAYRYTLYRYEILDLLSRWPASDAADIRLFCPAIIDYAYWLQEFDTTALADQILVMEAISRSPQRPAAVHGYVAFDPWRQIAEPATFDLIKDAVRNRGFIGVKVYPPMGFRPIGNAGLTARDFPPQLRQLTRSPGTRLDAVMRQLYAWCVADDVPIMTHCSFSQFPTAAYGDRAAPRHWAAVLNEYPTLRLNLGHCGGPWDMLADDRTRPHASEWTKQAIGLLGSGKYPNLYADIADAALVLDRNAAEAADDKRMTDLLNALLVRYPLARNRVMYGSDWSLLGREYHSATYYGNIKQSFAKNIGLNAEERVAFLGGNAARFLGLIGNNVGSDTPPKARLRLEAFYRRNQMGFDALLPFGAAVPVS